jgi:DNA-binding transcriptional regulator GbsR (MarR family)
MSTRAWRYLNSNGVLRASISFIEDETSMSHASISRSLRTLKERGLIKIVETDFKKGNVWEVSPVSLSENIAEAPQSEIPQNNTEATSKRGGSSLKSREEVPQNEGEYKKYLININKNLKSEKTEISELEKFEALELFETLSPTTQDKIISDFRLQEFPHGFYPPEQVVRALAALKWQNRRQQNWMSPGF